MSAWAAPAQDVIDQFEREQGSLIQMTTVFDQQTYTQSRLTSLGGNLLAGITIIIGVVFMLMGWRSAFIVGLALPLTVGGLMIGLAILGVPLHQMSLFGTLIALGLLIDNAIVIVDEVRKRLAAGLSPAGPFPKRCTIFAALNEQHRNDRSLVYADCFITWFGWRIRWHYCGSGDNGLNYFVDSRFNYPTGTGRTLSQATRCSYNTTT